MPRPARARGPRGEKQEQIVSEIRRWILAGRFRPGDRLPTYIELQAQFGVTPVTMQRALAQLKEDGCIRTRGKLGTTVAEDPPHLRRYALVFTSHPSDTAHWSTFWTAQSQAAQWMEETAGVRFPRFHRVLPSAQPGDYNTLEREVRTGRLAGIVFCHHPYPLNGTDVLERPGVPRVAVMSKPLPRVAAVYPDYASMIRRSIEHLAARGRRRLAALTPPSVAAEWLDLLVAEAARQGMDTGPHWIQSVSPTEPQWAGNCVRMLFNRTQSERPDALLIMDDYLVHHGTRGLIEAGVRVPLQASVVAHFNPGIRPAAAVPVRFIGFDARRLLSEAVAMIEAQWRGETPADLVLIPAEFEDEIAE